MLPFKFVDVKEFNTVHPEPSRKILYALKDSDDGIWTFFKLGTGKEDLLEFQTMPDEYQTVRGSKNARPFFKEVEIAALKAIKSHKFKKDLSPQTKETFGDIIDEL